MDDIKDLISSVFQDTADWFFNLLFVDFAGSIKDFGSSFFNRFENLVFTDDFIYILIGIAVFSFIVHLVISIVRG